jgi:hypothetical protein
LKKIEIWPTKIPPKNNKFLPFKKRKKELAPNQRVVREVIKEPF